MVSPAVRVDPACHKGKSVGQKKNQSGSLGSDDDNPYS